jgi:hypothetical protein
MMDAQLIVVSKSPETGLVTFLRSEDSSVEQTPGVFIRAEHATMFAAAVNAACEFKLDALHIEVLDALLDVLIGKDIRLSRRDSQ